LVIKIHAQFQSKIQIHEHNLQAFQKKTFIFCKESATVQSHLSAAKVGQKKKTAIITMIIQNLR
jgi:hypothetical protein